jgi:hypothetical protein
MLVRRNRFGAYRFSIKRPGIKDPHRCIGTTTDVYLYEPRDAWRLGGGGGFGPAATGRGENPPRGAVIHYVLKKERDKDAEPITLEILDDAGAVIRTFSSAETELDRCMRENTEPRNRREVELLETGAGMNRWVWDLRRQPLHCVPDVRLFQGWEGARVVPGTYQARLTVDERIETRTFDVLPDPREEVTPEQFAALDAYVGEVTAFFNAMMGGLEDLRRARSQIGRSSPRTSRRSTSGSRSWAFRRSTCPDKGA